MEHDKMEVTSGLKAGEQIVIKNPERLYPSMEVSVYQATPKNIKG
jgi:membrane fusion protein (multidrug efflux system)